MIIRASWDVAHELFKDSYTDFLNALSSPEVVQQNLLSDLIEANRLTSYGQSHAFRKIKNYHDFSGLIPIIKYEDLTKYIDQIVAGEKNILTAEDPEFVELTGGSSAGSKVIPHHTASIQGFQNALFPWFYDLLQRRPAIKSGLAYFSISPAGRSSSSFVKQLKLGLQDTDYFGEAGLYLRRVLAVPLSVAKIDDLDLWRLVTTYLLLSCRNLSFIFIWSPTFLIALLNFIKGHRDQLVEMFVCGLDKTHPHLSSILDLSLYGSNPSLAKTVRESVNKNSINTLALWPQLDTISCWMDAASEDYAIQLKAYFPNVYFQPKGLISTEIASSIPLKDEKRVLAIRSGFFEFVGQDNHVYQAHELQENASYRLIVSNYSGFCRYDTGDVIKVMGFVEKTPHFIFCGREDLTSDLCGEKLTEHFVLDCLKQLKPNREGCIFLKSQKNPTSRYILMVDSAMCDTPLVKKWIIQLEALLKRNPQYAYARYMNQLDSLDYKLLPNLLENYIQKSAVQNKSIGSLKPPVLI